MTAASEARRAVKRRRMWWLARIDAAVLSAGLIALVWVAAVDNAPSVQADELRQPPKVTVPAEVAGPVQPIFDFADVTPRDTGKEPVVVAGSVSVERPRTTSRVARPPAPTGAPETPDPVSVDPPAPVAPPEPVEPAPAPVEPEPVEPEPVAGLPVIVPVVEEEPPAPVEEEPPVDEPIVGLPEVVEPEPEVAG